MDRAELERIALFKVGDPVHHNSGIYRVSARYYRRSAEVILYDLVEVVRPGQRAGKRSKVPEHQVHKPSLQTLGLARDATDERVQRSHGRHR